MTTTIEDGLNSLLLAQPDIKGLVVDRIFPNEAPEGSSFPRVVYTVRSNQHDHVMSGSDGLPEMTLNVECQSGSYDQAKLVADTVRRLLDGYRGYAGEHFVNGAFYEDAFDQPSPAIRGEEKGIKARVVVLRLMYTEPATNLIGSGP